MNTSRAEREGKPAKKVDKLLPPRMAQQSAETLVNGFMEGAKPVKEESRLGKDLRAIRQEYIDKGGALLTSEQIDVRLRGGDEFDMWYAAPVNAPVPVGLPEELWQQWICEAAQQGNTALHKVARLLAYGENHFSQTYAQVAESLGFTEQTVKNAVSIVRGTQGLPAEVLTRVPFWKLGPLSVRGLTVEEKLDLLSTVDVNETSTAMLWATVKEMKKAKGIPERPKPQFEGPLADGREEVAEEYQEVVLHSILISFDSQETRNEVDKTLDLIVERKKQKYPSMTRSKAVAVILGYTWKEMNRERKR